ncbi:MAG: plasmid pRiA4b ORF-3 family protein [Thermoflavifilum sp.]|nr:plasmid pRiA4b ORF-3 family protein [Thermoflavifilum sp.]
MAVFRFRVYWEEDDSVYRDLLIRSDQTFADLHKAILTAFEFDQLHDAVFYRSNDNWQRGREIVLKKEDRPYTVEPLLMNETPIGAAVHNTNQKFVYVYDFQKNWTFLVELIQVMNEENKKLSYPYCTRKEGLAPSQYTNKLPGNDKLLEIEEKYDLGADDFSPDGFGEEGGTREDLADDEETF